MKSCFHLYNYLLLSLVCLLSSADAGFCSPKSTQNLCDAKWTNKQGLILLAANSSLQPVPYAQAEELFKEKKYDEVIRLLSGPTSAEPANFKLNILLAKAQIEKCAILKAKGDKSYKSLIQQPYRKGRTLHKIDETRPEPYYIVARSFLINNRPYRAEKTIKKALYFSPANAEYFVVLGDAYKAQAEQSVDSDAGELFSKAKDIYEKAIKATKDKSEELRSIVEERIREVSEKIK